MVVTSGIFPYRNLWCIQNFIYLNHVAVAVNTKVCLAGLAGGSTCSALTNHLELEVHVNSATLHHVNSVNGGWLEELKPWSIEVWQRFQITWGFTSAQDFRVITLATYNLLASKHRNFCTYKLFVYNYYEEWLTQVMCTSLKFDTLIYQIMWVIH